MRRARVAMFVLGDCQHDGRVRREATALQAHGYDVRLFAMATRAHGPGRATLGGVPVDRLPAASWPQRLLRASGRSSPVEHDPSAPGAGGRSRVSWVSAAARDVALRIHRPTLALSYTRLAVAAARAWGPDLVHAHDVPALPAAALAAREAGLPLVYDSHELWRGRNRRGQWRPIGRIADALLERSLAPRAAVVVTVCDSIAAWLSRRYALRRPPVVVRNVPVPPRPTSNRNLRALAGLTDERVLLYTGRVMEGRGLEFAVRCLHALPEDVVLVIMGYGDPAYVSGLASLAARQGVRNRVRMVGAVPAEEVSAVSSTADLAYVVIEPICPSYRYALPGKLFDAIAGGLPVLAADLPEIRRIVLGHGVGVVFTPRTATDLRAAVDRVLAGAPGYRQAAERAREELTWASEQHRLLGAYDRLARDGSERVVQR